MIYKGNICDGCKRAFEENDDIVVCPDCATPQHRECYEKNNCCVNSHLHNEKFVWAGNGKPHSKLSQKNENKNDETVPCPNCGVHNPKGEKQCKSCGMKLMVFGIDLASEIKQQNLQDTAQQSDNQTEIPHYEAPFTLGEGEGFDEEKNKLEGMVEGPSEYMKEHEGDAFEKTEASENPAPSFTPVSPEQIERSIVQNIESTGHSAYYDGYVDGIHVNLLATLIGPNAYKYIEKFRQLEKGKKVSFNWAAFFFPSQWCFYRKLYKVGIVIMTVAMLLTILITPSVMEMFTYFLEFTETLDPNALMDDAAFNEFISSYMKAVTPLMLYSFANFLISLVMGFTANSLYRKQTKKTAKAVIQAETKGEAGLIIAKNGGVSVFAVLIAYFAQQIMSSIISYLMFGF
ncbi:MAG: DUF2628 domain-containing protein [Clostridia bacterium]|nr:DUF2628 domain-containing protein [Clostridia bacterium]